MNKKRQNKRHDDHASFVITSHVTESLGYHRMNEESQNMQTIVLIISLFRLVFHKGLKNHSLLLDQILQGINIGVKPQKTNN